MEAGYKRHRALIEFLHQFELYKNSKIVEDERSLGDLVSLDTNDINKSVFLIGDFLNYPSGSTETVNLYKLLQTYLLDLKKRRKINDIIEE
jgi:hypothetical protein